MLNFTWTISDNLPDWFINVNKINNVYHLEIKIFNHHETKKKYVCLLSVRIFLFYYYYRRQLWSHDTVVLLLVTSIHVKRVNCYVYYDLFCYTGRFCLLRLRTTGSLPTACKQRMILDICYGLWLIMIDTEIFWFQMISTISWLIKCMLSIWRLDLFIKRHVSLTVNIYYSHMRKLILEPCAWICKHPWSDQKKISWVIKFACLTKNDFVRTSYGI
jgi:uncharacterized membrane protein YbaN (DUF454 family)